MSFLEIGNDYFYGIHEIKLDSHIFQNEDKAIIIINHVIIME